MDTTYILIMSIYGHGIAAIHSIEFNSDTDATNAGEAWHETLLDNPKNATTATWLVVEKKPC